MLSYPAAIPLSTRSLNHLAGLIRSHREQRRSPLAASNPAGKHYSPSTTCVTATR